MAVPLLVVLGACDSQVTAPASFDEKRCEVPKALVASLTLQEFRPEALRPALLHAAGPMASVLGPGELSSELSRSIELLGKERGPRLYDTHCRLLVIASSALEQMPNTKETLPDRDGIHIVLALLAGALSQTGP